MQRSFQGSRVSQASSPGIEDLGPDEQRAQMGEIVMWARRRLCAAGCGVVCRNIRDRPSSAAHIGRRAGAAPTRRGAPGALGRVPRATRRRARHGCGVRGGDLPSSSTSTIIAPHVASSAFGRPEAESEVRTYGSASRFLRGPVRYRLHTGGDGREVDELGMPCAVDDPA